MFIAVSYLVYGGSEEHRIILEQTFRRKYCALDFRAADLVAAQPNEGS